MNFNSILIGILVLGFVIFIIVIIDSFILRRLRKKYEKQQDEDKSRKGEEFRASKKRESGFKGLDKSKRGELLQTTATKHVRKNSNRSRIISKIRRRK